jgi:hypothetical protein
LFLLDLFNWPDRKEMHIATLALESLLQFEGFDL